MEDSAGAIVAVSQIKAVELDFFSTLNCSSSCFLHAPVGHPFYERCNPFNNIDPLSETDVIQTESLKSMSNEITSCRSWASCGFNDRNATLQVDFFPTHRLHSHSNSSTVFCFTEQNPNSVSFSLFELTIIILVKFSIEWLAFLLQE